MKVAIDREGIRRGCRLMGPPHFTCIPGSNSFYVGVPPPNKARS